MTDFLINLYQEELAKLDGLKLSDVATAYGDQSDADARTRIVKAQANLEQGIRDRKKALGMPDADTARAS